MRPHRRQAIRLPRPWDSPGKNTGVGCHFLLQCMKVKSESEVAQSCPTLSDPMDCSLPGPSIHEIFQARVLEWGAIAFSIPCISQMHMLAMITWKERKDRATYSSFSFWSCFLNSKPRVESVGHVPRSKAKIFTFIPGSTFTVLLRMWCVCVYKLWKMNCAISVILSAA